MESEKLQLLQVDIGLIGCILLFIFVYSTFVSIASKPLPVIIASVPAAVFALSAIEARQNGNIDKGKWRMKLGFFALGSAIFLIIQFSR